MGIERRAPARVWLIGVPRQFAHYRPRCTGFGIVLRPADLAADLISVGAFKAVRALTRSGAGLAQEQVAELARQAIELYVALLREEVGRASHLQRFGRAAWHFLSYAHEPCLISVATTGPILSYRNCRGDLL